jgi:hypothetical protein
MQELHGRHDACATKEAAAQRAGVVVTTPLLASAIAALQVEAAIRFLTETTDRAVGAAWRLTLHPGPTMDAVRFQRAASCPLHDPDSVIRDLTEIDMRWDECSVDGVIRTTAMERGVLRFDWPMTAQASCESCHFAWEPFVRRDKFRRTACPSCGSRDLVERQVLTAVERGSVWAERSLAALGQPPCHIYEIVSADGSEILHVRLGRDPCSGDARGASQMC